LIKAISSMATREVLAELADAFRHTGGIEVVIESVGGLDAANRVRGGNAFDIVVLADETMASLESEGRLVGGTRVPLATSGVAVAVRTDAALPDIATGDSVRKAVLESPSIGYSTGPSGAHIARLFDQWGIAEAIKPRIVQPPPGTAIGSLVASGHVALGFQQLSELVHLPGIRVVGMLPQEIQVTTTFTAGICATSAQTAVARAFLSFIASPECDAAKRRHGMEPA
jgi:molybdate transport system substrate-binding protein